MKRGVFVAAAAAVVALPTLPKPPGVVDVRIPLTLSAQPAASTFWDVIVAASERADFDIWVGPTGMCNVHDPVSKITFESTVEDFSRALAAAINAKPDFPLAAGMAIRNETGLP